MIRIDEFTQPKDRRFVTSLDMARPSSRGGRANRLSFTRALCLLAVVLMTGCASGAGGGARGPFSMKAGRNETLRIRVENHNYADATLYLIVRRGARRRLGFVTGKDTGTFTLRWRNSAPIAIAIDLVGGGKCTSDILNVDPGDTVDFRVPVALTRQNCPFYGMDSERKIIRR